ncbi:hypothetical protein IPM62_01290 [Candidatus Woesebacteria bacterium]|nr:MAG: hypothetical protein IPM62_01290 [Candidatus Woesebacteria bacterium]
MKKEIIVHIVFLLAFFLLISIYKTFSLSLEIGNSNWFTAEYLIFWLGGVIGMLMVFSDHFIYTYFLRPDEPSSQQAKSLISERKYLQAVDFLVKSHKTLDNLVFHNANFQSIFLLFGFFVITSTASILGRGIVLGFLLHLIIDMLRDLIETKSTDRWFTKFPVSLTFEQKRWYLGLHIALTLIIGIFL